MIASTFVAISIAAQRPPAQDAKVAPEPTAEKKMACCEKMAKGEGCCCCKGKDKGQGTEPAVQEGNASSEHAH